jgi:predicted DNA-binding helix-hairpin-helix protein
MTNATAILRDDNTVTIQITKEMDILPPRSIFPGSRCFSVCCQAPSQEDDELEDNSLVAATIHSSASKDGRCIQLHAVMFTFEICVLMKLCLGSSSYYSFAR